LPAHHQIAHTALDDLPRGIAQHQLLAMGWHRLTRQYLLQSVQVFKTCQQGLPAERNLAKINDQALWEALIRPRRWHERLPQQPQLRRRRHSVSTRARTTTDQ